MTAYLGDKAVLFEGTGVLDHIAFLATGVENMRRTFVSEGVGWRDRTVPSLGLDQAFIEDPSGVTIELNFPASEVAGPNQVTASGPAQIGEQS